MAKKGARGKYEYWITPEGLIKLKGWARDGLVDDQIAHNIGIAPKTLYDWEKKYPELRDALKQGKEVTDRKVENALFKRAVGYEYDEVTREPVIANKETGETKLKITKIVRKQVIPDTTAQIFWLKNRKPNEWRNKQEMQIDSHNINADITSLAELINNPVEDRDIPGED